MKKFIALFLAMALLCSCAVKNEPQEITEEPVSTKKEPVTVFTIAVQNGMSQAAMMGLDCFVEKVNAISNGKMAIKKAFCDDVLQKLDEGCELAFATNEEFARSNGDFLIYSSPFYFNNYNHLTLTLNSQQFNKAIENTNKSLLKAMPIGAFYDGNYYILSSREEMYDTTDQYEGRVFNIYDGQLLLELVLDSLGASVKERDEEYMLSNFGKNRNIAAMECKISLLGDITKREKVESFHICKSFHRAQINWIMLSEAAKSSLDEYQLAVLSEAIAYAIAKNDELVLENEEFAFNKAVEMGGIITAPNYEEFSRAAASAVSRSEKYGSLWNWQLYYEVKNLALKE